MQNHTHQLRLRSSQTLRLRVMLVQESCRSSSLSLQQIDVRIIRPIVHALPIRDVLHTTYHMHFHRTPNFNVNTSEYNSTIASSKQKSRSECVSQHALYFVTHRVVLPMPALNVLVALYCLIRRRLQLQRRRSTRTFYTKRSHHDIARPTSSGHVTRKNSANTCHPVWWRPLCALSSCLSSAFKQCFPLSAAARLKKDSTDKCTFQWSPSNVWSGDHLDSCTCLVMQTVLRGCHLFI